MPTYPVQETVTIDSLVSSFNGRTGDVVLQAGDYDKAAVGLGSVENAAQLRAALDYAEEPAPGAGDKLVAKDGVTGQPVLIDWSSLPSGGGVESFNGRTGAVVPASADYDADQVVETVGRVFFTPSERTKLTGIQDGAQVNPANLDSVPDSFVRVAMLPAERTKLLGVEAGAQVNTVTSVHGRTGDIVAQAGDYNADQVTDTASKVLMLPAERTKLSGVEDGAQVNTVTSVMGRTGAVVAIAGDYTADKITDGGGKVIMTDAERAKVAKIFQPQVVVNASRDLATTDINRVLHVGSGVTLTLVQSVLDAMTNHLDVIEIYATGSTVPVVAGTGVTLRRTGAGPTTVSLYGRAAIFKVNTSVGVIQGPLE